MKKHDYTDLIIACGAVIVVNTIFPIIDSASSYVISLINKSINKLQLDMQLDQAEAQAASEIIAPSPANSNVIGFAIPSESEESEEEYEW